MWIYIYRFWMTKIVFAKKNYQQPRPPKVYHEQGLPSFCSGIISTQLMH